VLRAAADSTIRLGTEHGDEHITTDSGRKVAEPLQRGALVSRCRGDTPVDLHEKRREHGIPAACRPTGDALQSLLREQDGSGAEPIIWPREAFGEISGANEMVEGERSRTVIVRASEHRPHVLRLHAPSGGFVLASRGVDGLQHRQDFGVPVRAHRRECTNSLGCGSLSVRVTLMAETTLLAGVSFARTPLTEISAKDAEIRAAGWEPTGTRGDPWAATYRKQVPEDDPDPERELRLIMGDYWLDPEAIRDLMSRAKR